MKSKIEKIKKIFNLLKEHTKQPLVLTLSSLNRLTASEIKDLYELLKTKPLKTTDSPPRPYCPVGKNHSIGQGSLYEYKVAMADYIAPWGFSILNPMAVPTSLFESLANYFENNS